MTGRPPGTGAAATGLRARSATSSVHVPALHTRFPSGSSSHGRPGSACRPGRPAYRGKDRAARQRYPYQVIRAHSTRRCSNWPTAGRPVVPTKSGRPIMPKLDTGRPGRPGSAAALAAAGRQRAFRGPQHRCIPGSGTNREKAGGTWPRTGKKAFSARSDGLRFPSPRRDPERYCCRYAAAVRRLPPGPTSRSGGTAA
jgi:hypothetical protein